MRTSKVAIVYDRVNKWGGAERVLLALHELFPKAPLYTSVYHKEHAPWADTFFEVKTSFLQKIPFATANHEYFALAMPIAFESFDFSTFDVVISVTSEAAKGIITGPNTIHICYCLTPTRYLWSGRDTYFNSRLKQVLSKPAVTYLRKWDVTASSRADHVVGISSEVKNRIKRYYGRGSTTIYPPVELDQFSIVGKQRKDYYLLVSRLVRYKKVDLAIKAFNKTGKKLIIVGKGREESKLKKMASKNITFFSQVTDYELAKLYKEAIALIFPQREDFGLVAVEALASGTPVIAYKKGGALDTVMEGVTGTFFRKQTVASLSAAVESFDSSRFNPKLLRLEAEKFSKDRFLSEFATMLKQI